MLLLLNRDHSLRATGLALTSLSLASSNWVQLADAKSRRRQESRLREFATRGHTCAQVASVSRSWWFLSPWWFLVSLFLDYTFYEESCHYFSLKDVIWWSHLFPAGILIDQRTVLFYGIYSPWETFLFCSHLLPASPHRAGVEEGCFAIEISSCLMGLCPGATWKQRALCSHFTQSFSLFTSFPFLLPGKASLHYYIPNKIIGKKELFTKVSLLLLFDGSPSPFPFFLWSLLCSKAWASNLHFGLLWTWIP